MTSLLKVSLRRNCPRNKAERYCLGRNNERYVPIPGAFTLVAVSERFRVRT